jgi:hypothetical protein
LAYLQTKAYLSPAQLKKVHGEDYIKSMEEETRGTRYEEQASWGSFDFGGAISLLEKKQVRPPIEKMLEEVRGQPISELPPWAAVSKEQLRSLEEELKTDPFYGNNDISDHANLLYDFYKLLKRAISTRGRLALRKSGMTFSSPCANGASGVRTTS